MILLWGVPGDAPLDAVYEQLEQIGADFRLVDQRQVAQMQAELRMVSGNKLAGKIVDMQGEIDLEQVGAAYIRPFETSRASGLEQPDDPAYLRALTVDSRLIAWAELSNAMIVNRPSAMAVNNSKPYQLAMIASYGFAVPETLVTTDVQAVRHFQECHADIIYKSVSGVRSIVSRLSEGNSSTVGNVANCPTQFQEYIPGTDIRVHVIGDKVLATEITSTADDYRYASRVNASLAMMPIDLPEDFVDRCIVMVKGMGLHLAGIDFRRAPTGKWYCLEVNPSPGFTFYEAATGQRIAAKIADMLLEFDRLNLLQTA